MSKLNETRARLRTDDLVVMVLVENLAEDREMRATPGAIAAMISGAPSSSVRDKLERLISIGVLYKTDVSYHVSNLGAAVMELDVEGFEPGPREQARREQLVRNSISSVVSS